MAMSIREAESALRIARDGLVKCAPSSTVVVMEVTHASGLLRQVHAGGYRPEIMGSMMLLAAEIERVQREQQARMAALLQGIRELVGDST